MTESRAEELRHLARRVLGRDLSAEEALQAEPRLMILAQTIERLEAWQAELGDTPPATTFHLPGEPSDG
ncbi:hypothetical protein [Sabulicella glaciei]|uniref:Uncharacterized protein n=1 Tax=Sabulicella glaciei TaxID=2984948 RepID=A0ABT3NWR5_9PROT|nr:hypothetical protein [Roseococcus sp. MDT2-1-1]MCW8086570.1 hypothetical protein [Roseococcus sp. MDT2-1-1]